MPRGRRPPRALRMISGMTRCGAISGADQRASPCLLPDRKECVSGMSSTYQTPAHGRTPGALSPGHCQRTRRSRCGRCWKTSITRTLPWALSSRSIRSPSSRRWPGGGITPVTSATAWTVRRCWIMMISASELPSGRPRRPASPTVFRPAVAWIRSCAGRTSSRCWTGTRPPPWRNSAGLSATSADRSCVRSKQLSGLLKGA